MAGRTQAEIDVLPYQKVTKAMLHGGPDEGNDVSEVNLTEYVLEAEVLLSHSWVEDMEECQKALNSHCESANWKRVKIETHEATRHRRRTVRSGHGAHRKYNEMRSRTSSTQ